jgi:hypothetical protein
VRRARRSRFSQAIDISDVAIERARAHSLPNLVKLPLIERMIDLLPDQLIYPRLYILQVSK